MAKIKRNCDYCGKEYEADSRNLNRGWGLCCSKSCAAKLREQSKPGSNSEKVPQNNIRRTSFNDPHSMAERMTDSQKHNYNISKFGVPAPNIHGGSGVITSITSEGHRVMDGTAFDEWDEPVYGVDGLGEYDDGDSEYWDSKDY